MRERVCVRVLGAHFHWRWQKAAITGSEEVSVVHCADRWQLLQSSRKTEAAGCRFNSEATLHKNTADSQGCGAGALV